MASINRTGSSQNCPNPVLQLWHSMPRMSPVA